MPKQWLRLFSDFLSQLTPTPQVRGSNRFYGDAGAIAQQAVNEHRLNGVTFHTVLTAGEQTFSSANPSAAFAYFAIPSEANVSSCYPSSTDPNAGTLLTNYTILRGSNVWR